jgi:hypothetical protein
MIEECRDSSINDSIVATYGHETTPLATGSATQSQEPLQKSFRFERFLGG